MEKTTKEKLKKFLIYFLGAFLIALFMMVFYIYIPNSFKAFDNKITDFMFNLRGEVVGSKDIVIIDIDEKSINTIGQWPWSRDVVSKLVEKSTAYGAGIIGFDIVFAEYDRTSPSSILKKLHIKDELNVENYDLIFAETLSRTPVILGYQFEMNDKPFIKKIPPSIPTIVIEKNKQGDSVDMVPNASGVILNNDIVQNAGYSSGFFNNIPDDSGITRSVPLVMRYEGQLYPSLALEMIRAANGIKRIIVNYNELGIENIQLGDFYIPTDRYGRLLINFRGKERSYKYISAVDILEDKVDANELKGKILFVGTSAAGLFDLRATPFESIFPGVEIHANAVDNILNNEYITLPSWVDGVNISYFIIIILLSTFLVYVSNIIFIPILFIILFIGIIALNYIVLFGYHISLNTFFPLIALVVSFASSMIINYFYEVKQKNLIKHKFSSKVSKSVMEDILKGGDDDILSAKDKEVTIFFSDIRGFTTISEAMKTPRELIDYLNRYLNPVTDIIIKNEGTIDKYIGDAVMAYWNAPSDVENHQDKALKTSLEQFAFLDELNVILEKEGKFPIKIGIGLNTGNATVGEMGSTKRSDYTVIGDAINLGSRLESLCKGYGSKLIISEFTKEGLKDEYVIRNLDLVRVKGKMKPVEIFEVFDYKHHPILYKNTINEVIKEVEYFNEAILKYRNSEFAEAKSMFEDIQKNFNPQNTTVCGIYIERCTHYIEYPPIDFDGVFVHITK